VNYYLINDCWCLVGQDPIGLREDLQDNFLFLMGNHKLFPVEFPLNQPNDENVRVMGTFLCQMGLFENGVTLNKLAG
jgi:hypothetical protein